MALPKLQGYAVLREVNTMPLSEITRLAQNGTAFVGVAGKVYEVQETDEGARL